MVGNVSRCFFLLQCACVVTATMAVSAMQVSAEDVWVDSDTSFQVYEVSMPGLSTFLTRRRLVQRVDAGYLSQLGSAKSVWFLRSGASLRIDQDFGQTCLVDALDCVGDTDVTQVEAFQPLARNTLIDVPSMFVELSNTRLGLDLGIGRYTDYNNLGFVRYDGAHGKLQPEAYWDLHLFAGRQVTSTSVAGTDIYDPIGGLSVDNSQLAYGFDDRDQSAFVWGASITGGDPELVSLRSDFRDMWDSTGLVQRAVGVALTASFSRWLSLRMSNAWNLIAFDLFRAHAALQFDWRAWQLLLEYQMNRPWFDQGSIWAFFQSAALHQGRVATTWHVAEDTQLGAALLSRHGLLSEDADLDLGGEGFVTFRRGRWDLSLDASVWSGSLGPTATIWNLLRYGIIPGVFGFFRASTWYVQDVVETSLHGVSLSGALGTEVQIATLAKLTTEYQHSFHPQAGHRGRFIAWLHLEAWR